MTGSVFGKAGAVFGPAEIANLTEAYKTALSCIDEETVEVGVPGHQLRRQLASRIIEEAKTGQSDPRLLAERAIASLVVKPSH